MLAATKSVLVLGGTGVFGRRIAQHLLLHGNLNNVDIHVVGRDAAKLTRIKNELLAGQASALACKNVRLEVHSVDIYQPTALDAVLEAVCPAVTIDAVGPFRSRSFATARACLEAGSHFLDLADDPEYVSHFPAAVDAFARDANKVAITGCSTTPGLTSTAVAALAKTYFEDNEVVSVDVSMAPGNKLPRGLATVQKVVSDIGSRFATLRGGAWRETTGWATIEERTFPGIGARLVGQCNVPDNVLVPQMLLSRGEEERERRAEAAAQCQQSSLKDSSFWAGLELSPLVRVLGALARFLPSVDYGRFAPLFLHASKWFAGIGSADGGMKVRMRGRPRGGGGGGAGARTTMLRTVEWSLFAGSGDGPMTPSILSAMLACRLLEQPAAASSSSSNSSAAESGGSRLRVGAGAHPCVNLVSLRDFEDEVAPYDFSFHRRVADGGECDTYTLGDILSVDAKGNLPPFFEDFHFGHRAESAEVAGSFRVGGHSNGIVAAVTQTVAGFPPPGEAVPTKVKRVVDSVRTAKWERTFGDVPLASTISYDGGLMWEEFEILGGLLGARFGFHVQPLRCDSSLLRDVPLCQGLKPEILVGVWHKTQKFQVAGISVPRFLMPTADGWSVSHTALDKPVGNSRHGWLVHVEVIAPLFGKILSYDGDVQPSSLNVALPQ